MKMMAWSCQTKWSWISLYATDSVCTWHTRTDLRANWNSESSQLSLSKSPLHSSMLRYWQQHLTASANPGMGISSGLVLQLLLFSSQYVEQRLVDLHGWIHPHYHSDTPTLMWILRSSYASRRFLIPLLFYIWINIFKRHKEKMHF